MKDRSKKTFAAWLKSFFSRKSKHVAASVEEKPASSDFWRDSLRDNGTVFCGLYAPLFRVAAGSSRKPGRVLAEWRDRTALNLKDTQGCEQSVAELSQCIDRNDPAGMTACASQILTAAAEAGITHDKTGEVIILDDLTAPAYLTDEGDPLFIGDQVRIVSPAWYQNAKVIENGICAYTDAPSHS